MRADELLRALQAIDTDRLEDLEVVLAGGRDHSYVKTKAARVEDAERLKSGRSFTLLELREDSEWKNSFQVRVLVIS
jgi:hypothetical protein